MSLPLAAWHVLRLPWLTAATLGTVLLLAVAVLSVRAARRRVSYETWHAVHLLVYVSVVLSFVHQLAGPDLTGRRVLQVLWTLLYCHVFVLVLRHRVLTPLRNASRHRMRVAAVVEQGPGVVSIPVEGRDLDQLAAESGQFFRRRFLAPDHWTTAHPFSLSAAPTATHLRLTVKTLGDGSRRLQDLEAGTWVLAEGPYGALTAARRPGAGCCSSPVASASPRCDPCSRPCRCPTATTCGCCTGPAVMPTCCSATSFDGIAAQRGARLHYLVGEGVRFTPQLFLQQVPDLLGLDVYLCGPPAMAAAVREGLRAAGLPSRQLHEERFDF